MKNSRNKQIILFFIVISFVLSINNDLNISVKLCKNTLLPKESDKCIPISQKLLLNSSKIPSPDSYIYSVNKHIFDNYICSNILKYGILGKDCLKLKSICTQPNKNSKQNNIFLKTIQELNDLITKNIKCENHFNILEINVSKINLMLGYYFIENIANELFENFTLTLFKTESNTYLYKINKVINYQYKLKQPNIRYRDNKNPNFCHENKLFKNNYLKNNYNLIKKEIEKCSLYKKLYIYYKKFNKSNFFLFYKPIIEISLQKFENFDEVSIIFDSFDLKFSNMKKLNTTFSQLLHNIKMHFLEKNTKIYNLSGVDNKDLFLENKKFYQSENEYLENTVNEKIKRSGKINLNKNLILDLHNPKQNLN